MPHRRLTKCDLVPPLIDMREGERSEDGRLSSGSLYASDVGAITSRVGMPPTTCTTPSLRAPTVGSIMPSSTLSVAELNISQSISVARLLRQGICISAGCRRELRITVVRGKVWPTTVTTVHCSLDSCNLKDGCRLWRGISHEYPSRGLILIPGAGSRGKKQHLKNYSVVPTLR